MEASLISDVDTNEEPLLSSSIDEVNNKPSFTAKSFYRNSCTTPKSRVKLPFYLRYSLGDSNLGNHGETSHLADVTNISETGLHSVPEGHWKIDTQTPPHSSAASASSCHPEGSRLASGVQHRRRPCYYIEPSKRLKSIHSAQQESSTKIVSEDIIRSIRVENISAVMPRTPSIITDSPTTTADNSGGCGSERKFFKNRPSSVTTSQSPMLTKRGGAGSTTVVCRGFSLNFVPRRLSASFEKRVGQQKKRKSRNPRRPQRKRSNNSGCAKDEKPLPPLSNIFPELDLQPLSSPAAPLPTNTCDHLINPQQQCDDQLSTAENDCTYSNSCGGSSSSLVHFSSDSNSSESSTLPEKPRLFPIFSNRRNRLREASLKAASESSILLPKFIKDSADAKQLTLDAGQKRFGAIQCPQCTMFYTRADPVDETTHAKFHYSLLTTLKFTGWKKERVVQEYSETGCRIILVLPDDPKYVIRKVEDLNHVMGQELGFPDSTLSFQCNYKIFLYISDEKRIDGCCIAEAIKEGFRVVPNSPNEQSQTQMKQGRRPCCCRTEPEACPIGISKIWVYGPSRRTSIASKLLDCVRHWFQYGVPVPKNKLAFSDPTPEGMLLATKYTGSMSFLVYKCQTNYNQQ
ncbi:N-acetyltransferase ESCO2-like [Octopus sinensis]|uniref:N-acetyltransferase ESCO2-like n=1 Tax=Octopus sinensis TaxID=2607531 RepID=A0A7E6FKT6_9MOLL|nr:N-acetyltransferase ESCO2-like [Octopus sinensis]